MASSDTDAATEALIAQMIAGDLGEAYTDQLRPIGSHYGDYEDPLSSYERHRLENPDIEDEAEDWDLPPPRAEPAEGEGSSIPLPEGALWDSSVNEDPRIDSTPATRASDQITPMENWDDESTDHMDTTDDGSQTEFDPDVPSPTHQLHDPIHYHDPDTPTIQSPRHVSQPIHEPRLGYIAAPPSSRHGSSPSQLETAIHHNSRYPQEQQQRRQHPRRPYTETPVSQDYLQEQQGRQQIHDPNTEDHGVSRNITAPSQLGGPAFGFAEYLQQQQQRQLTRHPYTGAPTDVGSIASPYESATARQMRVSERPAPRDLNNTTSPYELTARQMRASEGLISRDFRNLDFSYEYGTAMPDLNNRPSPVRVPIRESYRPIEDTSPEAAIRSWNASQPPIGTPRPSDVFARHLSNATNERLLARRSNPDLGSAIDLSSSKNKGKAPVPSRSPLIPYGLQEVYADLARRRRRKSKPTFSHELMFDPEAEITIDAQTGLPFFKVPWFGDRWHLGPGEQPFPDRVDVRVGDEETLDSILEDIGRREEMRKEGWI